MAGPRACSSPRRNPSSVKRGNDEHAEQAPKTSIDGSGAPTQAPAVELQLIAVALAFSLLFPLPLTASSTLHSSRELFTEPQGALTNISGSYAPSANTSRAHRLAPPLQLLLLPKSYSNST